MPALDVVDQTFILAPATELRDIFCDEQAWKALGMNLRCYEDRGIDGKRWTLSESLTGTAEVWLEPSHDGVIVHVYIQADPRSRRSRASLKRRYAVPVKRWILDVKAGYEIDRPAGVAPAVHGKISEQGEPGKAVPKKNVSVEEG
ncbi:MAG: hypothetical protein ACXWDC_10075 [Aeromicrobium sp.]